MIASPPSIAAAPSIGSGWDVDPSGPDAPLAQHLAEWIAGSAVAPPLAAANVQTLQGRAVLEALAGDRLAQMGGHASQYATAAVARLLRPLEPLAAAGGWWCSGLDPLADWAPMEWGCFKGNRPRADRKYEHPIGTRTRCWWLRVPAAVAQLVADRHGLALPPDVAADGDGSAGEFWRWWAQTPALPLVITEGAKKAGALLSAGVPAVALPGIWNGAPKAAATGRPALLAELAAVPLKGRSCRVLFDCPKAGNRNPDEPKAARRLGRLLAAAGAEVLVGTVPGSHGKGADDHLAAGGTWEALAAALAPIRPEPVLPSLRAPDRIAPAGAYLGVACPLPSPELAPLVVLAAPIGAGKTEAIAAAVMPLAAEGCPVLMPSHRQALGQALAERLGVPWAPHRGDDERLMGAGFCWDSCCPSSALQITGHGWSGGVLVADEWMQACEHLLLSTGTALAGRRAEVLRTAAELLARMRQVIAADAQLAGWGVALLEALTGRRALVIGSEHRPMAGRALHCPEGFRTPQAAAEAFRAKWAELVEVGAPFLCWTSAQRADVANSPQRLAELHRQRRPGARVLVIDSTTPEAAAELAADPDGVAGRFDAIYCSPAVSSGISFQRWRPAAVIAYAGGRVATEHAAQALGRVRCPDVPAWIYAPERCPGAALRVGSGATDPAELIAALRAVADPLLGELQDAGDSWLQAWGELGAHRNRQRFAYRATIAGLLEREGWELQAPGPAPCPIAGALVGAELKAAAVAAREALDQAVIAAELLTATEAAELQRRRQLEPSERAALDRFLLAERWGLGAAAPSLELLEADRDGLRDRLRLGWLLTTPEAAALVPEHDWRAVDALDPEGRPFAPDRLRVTLGSRLGSLAALGVPALLQRFAAGDVIAADDPAVVALHATATAHRAQLAAAAGLSPAVLPTGTLRALLQACGWELKAAGRIKARGASRDAYAYRAAPIALPQGVDAQALAAVWLAELQAPIAGAKSSPIGILCRGRFSPTPPPPPRAPRPMAGFRALLAALAPPRAPAPAFC